MSERRVQVDFEVEMVLVSDLKPHPRNYREHPDDQIEHIIKSIEEHEMYRNIVVARDGTILAGHGVVEAAKRIGLEEIPAVRLDVGPDDPKALKVLTGDNEIGHLVDLDDRVLTELLKDIRDSDVDGLLGTGYDDMMLANLVYVTRPESEIADFDAAAHWVGMPEYDWGQKPLQVVVNFRNKTDRVEFARMLGLEFSDSSGKAKSIWWPHREKETPAALIFEG